MTDDAKIKEAAAWIDAGHVNGDRYEPLPATLMPDSIAGAYDIQRAFVERMAGRGRPAFGWKIALTAETMQQMVGMDRPVCGTIVAPRLDDSGVDLKASDYGRLAIECEVALYLGQDLKPKGSPYTVEEVAQAVDACAAAFEVADDRNADYTRLEAMTMIADNAWNAGMVLGAVHTNIDYVRLAEAEAVLEIDGVEVGRGVGADALGHPFNGLLFLANELTGLGRTLSAGDWILTGTVIRTQFPTAGSELIYRHSLLGDVKARVI